MRRMKTIISILFISFLPYSLALGQEKKNEQKVKVIIADKTGTKVVIDTTFTGTGTMDSIIVKGGNVIYIGKNDTDLEGKPGKQINVMAHVDKDGKNTEHQYVYINKDKVDSRTGEETFDVMVSDDEFDNDVNETRIVIAKNGITVSIEGNDEAKVQELARDIEQKLGVNNEKTGSAVKEVEKNIIKKN